MTTLHGHKVYVLRAIEIDEPGFVSEFRCGGPGDLLAHENHCLQPVSPTKEKKSHPRRGITLYSDVNALLEPDRRLFIRVLGRGSRIGRYVVLAARSSKLVTQARGCLGSSRIHKILKVKVVKCPPGPPPPPCLDGIKPLKGRCRPQPPPEPTSVLSIQFGGSGAGKVTAAGYSCSQACTAIYSARARATVLLTAVPTAGSTFEGWGGACSGTGRCKIVMKANMTLNATFTTIPSYTLKVTKVGFGDGDFTINGGSVCSFGGCSVCVPGSLSGQCSYTFPAGTKVMLTASPGRGSYFAGWGGACAGNNSCTVTLNSAQDVTADSTNTAGSSGGGSEKTALFTTVGCGNLFSVPSGVTSMQIEATGGSRTIYYTGGGFGGQVTAVLSGLSVGQVLDICVGYGGGTGGAGEGDLQIPGGGGASGVALGADFLTPVIVAGGGGGLGGGAESFNGRIGGGGGGATQVAPGQGGAGASGGGAGSAGTKFTSAGPGVGGAGGSGGLGVYGGGGGGAGYFGGGGGGAGGAGRFGGAGGGDGGGGSNFCATTLPASVVVVAGCQERFAHFLRDRGSLPNPSVVLIYPAP
ncbi:MAG: InlB B-repeat-containing protein [Solirubrobacteraceae bacterium]